MTEYTVGERIWMGFELCFSLVIPKILFTYFILYVILKRALKENQVMLSTIFLTLLTLAILLFIERAIASYISYPLIFHYVEVSYWNAFGFLYAIIDIGFIGGIAIALKLIRYQFVARERENQLIREKLETELKYLRNQTSPHFLFNTLNNIYGLARKKSDDTAEVVMRLSKLLRYMIYETRSQCIKIGDEIRMLENLISLEEIRYTRGLTVNFKKQLDNENEHITPLLLLPFVENAFKHGVGENRFGSSINIDLSLSNGILHFYIENSKEANKTDEIVDSIGLGNVKRQLELMYRDYSLDVQNETELFRVTLNVNLRSYANL